MAKLCDSCHDTRGPPGHDVGMSDWCLELSSVKESDLSDLLRQMHFLRKRYQSFCCSVGQIKAINSLHAEDGLAV